MVVIEVGTYLLCVYYLKKNLIHIKFGNFFEKKYGLFITLNFVKLVALLGKVDDKVAKPKYMLTLCFRLI